MAAGAIIYGDEGNDIINGGNTDNQLFGGSGNDILQSRDANDSLAGEAGNDALYGGAGNNTLNGGDGNDELQVAAGMSTLLGGDGDDAITVYGTGEDIIDGGAGVDLLTLDRSDMTQAVNITGSDFTLADGTTVTGIERLSRRNWGRAMIWSRSS